MKSDIGTVSVSSTLTTWLHGPAGNLAILPSRSGWRDEAPVARGDAAVSSPHRLQPVGDTTLRRPSKRDGWLSPCSVASRRWRPFTCAGLVADQADN